MARIPDAELSRLKSEVSLLRLVEAEGIALKPHGADHIGRCPFHEDKTPSLVITPKTNLYHCFGCGAAGSVIDWVMKCRNVSFRKAVDILREDNSSLVASGIVPNATLAHPCAMAAEAAEEPPPMVESSISDPALLKRVVSFYHQALKESPEALAYLEKRGLADPELIDHFQLGFANRTLGYRLPSKQVKAGADLRSQLQKLGILRSSGHEHFNGSLVVPVFDEHGDLAEMYGRKIGDRLRKGTPLHLYLPGPHRGVFNREALSASKEIILCESLIDALTFWCAGYRNVTCAYGIEGLTDELMQAFCDHGTERILIAYDRDEAGNRASEKLAKRLMGEGMACFRVLFPKGMDANDYACQVTPATKSLGLAIRKAEWLGNGAGALPPGAPAYSPSMDIAAPAIETAADPIMEAAKKKKPISSSAAKPKAELEVIDEVALPASPQPEMAPVDVEANIGEHEVVMAFSDRRYRVRGLEKNLAYEQLKINLMASNGEAIHVDTLDLYSAKQRQSYLRQAAVELGVTDEVIKQDLAKVLLKLEALQEDQIRAALDPKEESVELSSEEQTTALELLRDPDLLDRIVADFEHCGLVGESTNTLVGYLAAISRKLDNPLAIIIQSTSAAGKSTLMDAILDFVPEEERVHYSAMTGQSLFYMGEGDLKHKILAISEEEGVQQAAYALKLLQSQGELTIASTGKDDATGNLVTREYKVEGPVMLLLTTTAIEIDDELLNRCMVLTVNESREQTRRIHDRQRKERTLEGLLAHTEADTRVQVHRNAQRLIKALKVVNPYAEQLTFLDDKTRTRRDHQKYLTLIDTIALLHQHQREIRSLEHHGQVIEYIEVTLDDIAVANRLAHEVLGRSLDELPPQTRRLLGMICALVAEKTQEQAIERSAYRFSRREVRESTGWGNTQLKMHLGRLEDMEYLLVHGGGRGRTISYELTYDGDPGSVVPHLIGLLDLQSFGYDEKKSGVKGKKSGQINEKSGPSRGQVAPKSGGSRGPQIAETPGPATPPADPAANVPKKHFVRKNNGASYRTAT